MASILILSSIVRDRCLSIEELNEDICLSHKAFSNQDIEEIISMERSMKDDKTISDFVNDIDLKHQRSEGGATSPYLVDFNEQEQPISNNSLASHEDVASN